MTRRNQTRTRSSAERIDTVVEATTGPPSAMSSSTPTPIEPIVVVRNPSATSTPNTTSCRRSIPMPITPAGSINSSRSISPASSAGQTTNGGPDPGSNDQLATFILEQRDINKKLLELLEEDQSVDNKRRKRTLPLDVTTNVRAVYVGMEEKNNQQLWDFEKSFTSDENSLVNSEVTQGVKNRDKTTKESTIRDAIRAHFKTRRRQYQMVKKKTDKIYQKQQRRRSRLNTKRLQRKKALAQSTSYTEEQKASVEDVLLNSFMSSEESESEPEPTGEHDSDSDGEVPSTQKVLNCKALPWRSTQCADIFKRLDRRVQRQRSQKGMSMLISRRPGGQSRRAVPLNAPEWALK